MDGREANNFFSLVRTGGQHNKYFKFLLIRKCLANTVKPEGGVKEKYIQCYGKVNEKL